MSGQLPLRWVRRRVPLAPCGLLAHGEVARRLARRLLERSLDGLRGLAVGDVLLLLGEPQHLPWEDGVLYLGLDPREPGLLTSTLVEPELHPRLVLEALGGAPPLALWPERGLALPAGRARELHPAGLRRWLEGP